MGILGMAPFSTVADYTLTTIPMFMLMAYFSASSGLARDLFKAGANCLSHIRGGLGVATVFACGIFGAMSGASVAAASVMSTIAYPEMRRYGYSEELAAGTVGIGATLDLLIPPSVAFIIYGVTTQTSIAKLLIAGVVPGIIVGILLSLAIFIWVAVRPQDAPATYQGVLDRALGEHLPRMALAAADYHRDRVSLHGRRHAHGSGRHRRLSGRRHRRGFWSPLLGGRF